MKYGINLLLWTSELHDALLPLLEVLRDIGYDGVEVPILNPHLDYASWGRRLDDLGLQRTAATVCHADTNPISEDPIVRQAGIDHIKRIVDRCGDVGATHLVGPCHSALGEFTGRGPTADEWQWGVESVRQMAAHAQEVGVKLGLECLNRFENYLLNTHADLARFVRQVGHPHCCAIYDTFHAHMEEKRTAAAIHSCADVLCHVHISENDRSTPGSGSVRWSETFDTLNDIGYDEWLVVEAFGSSLPDLAAATKIWRRMYDTEEQLARDALAFMNAEVGKRSGDG